MGGLSFGKRIVGERRQPFDNFSLLVIEFRPMFEFWFAATRATLLSAHVKLFFPNELNHLLASCPRVS